MTILHIDSSITGDASASRTITRAITGRLAQSQPGSAILHRDLVSNPLPHLTLDAMADTAVLEEFLAANTVVIGAPMYNFTVSSQLKAWIDRILIAGKTFSYTAEGPQGLAGGKRVIIASSRGGVYVPDTAQAAMDFQETYLRAVFRFIGIDTVEFVRAEGIAFGSEQRETALKNAFESFRVVAATTAPAKAA